jgi:hypothetical protein
MRAALPGEHKEKPMKTQTISTVQTTQTTLASLTSIDNDSLSNVTGGGLFGAAVRLGRRAVPFVRRTAPVVGHAIVDAAKWTGIPAAIGSGAALVQRPFNH